MAQQGETKSPALAKKESLVMAFGNIIGQEKWTKFILDAWKKDRLAHAILISGPSGCGKEFLALEITKLLNCPEEENSACGYCSSCRRISSLEHPNLILQATGQRIALVGETGSLEGSELHFEIWHNREKQNPLHWLKKNL